ncbi:hypothetical protein MES5069_170047 [Mesorhizobium escarrei]|uniref:Uncharacterized protein n=1 Tax=Mesorhizobium escarrei TaxID=666018 RepID=A0ABM9DLB6_9HYPH|nr:hypothetical protein MES5069_170047 [Mesorhizobium escarrei]
MCRVNLAAGLGLAVRLCPSLDFSAVQPIDHRVCIARVHANQDLVLKLDGLAGETSKTVQLCGCSMRSA